MNALERALAILLLLTRRRLYPASDLAQRFEVSVRTIYRDIDRTHCAWYPDRGGTRRGRRVSPRRRVSFAAHRP